MKIQACQVQEQFCEVSAGITLLGGTTHVDSGTFAVRARVSAACTSYYQPRQAEGRHRTSTTVPPRDRATARHHLQQAQMCMTQPERTQR